MAGKALWAVGLAAVLVVGGVAAYAFLYEGTVNLRVQDDVGIWAHVYVNFTGVYIHQAGAGNDSWTPLTTAAGKVDLASLTNTSQLLASLKIGPGHYTQLRIDVGSAYGILSAGGPAMTLSVPSGVLKTNEQFDVVSGKTTTLTADISLDHIVQTAAGWVFTPVIGDVSVSTS